MNRQLDSRLSRLEHQHGMHALGFHAVRVVFDPHEPGACERADAEYQAAVDELLRSGRANASDEFLRINRVIVAPEAHR